MADSGSRRRGCRTAGAAERSGPRAVHSVVVDEPSRTDRWFNRVTLSSGVVVLALLTLVGVFLLLRSRQALESGLSYFSTDEWRTDVHPPHIGVLGMLTGTVLVALVAVAIAIPLGVCTALYITEYASLRWRRWLTSLVDLLAAIPSLLFGIWGFLFLSDKIVPISQWLTDHLGWIPIFRTDPGRS